MFRVLYGIRDQEVVTSINSSTMFSSSTTAKIDSDGIVHEPGQNAAPTLRRGGVGHGEPHRGAALRFPGFSTHEKQFEHAEEIWISMNVGGSVYTTTISTLQKVMLKHDPFVCITDFRKEVNFINIKVRV